MEKIKDLDPKENTIELYYPAVAQLIAIGFLWSLAFFFICMFGIYMPYMALTDSTIAHSSDLYVVLVVSTLFGWTIGGLVFWIGLMSFAIYKRRNIPVLMNSDGIHNLAYRYRTSKTEDIPWQSITKVASTSRTSMGIYQGGPQIVVYAEVRGKLENFPLPWNTLFLPKNYQQIHYFIAQHVGKTCVLEYQNGPWPTL